MENEEVKREIGEMLKAERARRGLSLEDVQAAIKINKRFIKALEDNDFAKMPTGVAARGFLKNYASFLGLDAKLMLARLNEKLGAERPAPVPAAPPKKAPPDFPLKNIDLKKAGMCALAAVLLLIMIFVLFSCSAGKRAGRIKAEVPAAVPSEYVERYLTLEVRSVDRAWIQVDIDGVPLSSEVVSAGERRIFTARDNITIKTGNAGGVRVIVNGRNLGALGDRNAVVEKQFSR